MTPEEFSALVESVHFTGMLRDLQAEVRVELPGALSVAGLTPKDIVRLHVAFRVSESDVMEPPLLLGRSPIVLTDDFFLDGLMRMRPAKALEVIRAAFMKMLLHELDEGLWCAGKRVREPHPEVSNG